MTVSLARRDIVVIGASAGGVRPLIEVVAALPANFPAAVLIALHIPADSEGLLPEILERQAALDATHPNDGDPLRSGHVYVAPPDLQMAVQDGRVRLARAPRENGHRPSIDVLFSTAARSHGAGVVGVLLSGALSDGVLGLWEIKRRGGLAIIQDPSEATFSGMPQGALDRVDVDAVLPAAEIGRLLASIGPANETSDRHAAAEEPMDNPEGGVPSVYSCPDCGGVLWEVQKGDLVHYRCRLGHAYSADALAASQHERLEDALWTALRALDENAELSARLAERTRKSGITGAAARYEERARDAHERSRHIREAIESIAEARQTDGPAAIPEPLRGDRAIDEKISSDPLR